MSLAFLAPVFEWCLIALLINYLLTFFWNSRSIDLIFGILAFSFLFILSSWLNLSVLHKLMLLVSNVAVIALIVIFQPELRTALSKLSLKRKRHRELSEFDRFVDHLLNSIQRMSERRVGALIVIENEDDLYDLAKKGVALDAQFSSELLETIFVDRSPLHDGAVIISDRKIVAASAILPLAETPQYLMKNMGTRHRAALGTSQQYDAIILVVSEETGKISFVRDGVMTRGLKRERLLPMIRAIFGEEPKQPTQRTIYDIWTKIREKTKL